MRHRRSKKKSAQSAMAVTLPGAFRTCGHGGTGRWSRGPIAILIERGSLTFVVLDPVSNEPKYRLALDASTETIVAAIHALEAGEW